MQGQQKQQQQQQQPTVGLHVCLPDYLQFSIKSWRSSWVLQVGRQYEISVSVFNDKRQPVYASDNLRIEAEFDLNRFRVDYQSANGSYHLVTALAKGVARMKAELRGTLAHDKNVIARFEQDVHGEQECELLDPITINKRRLVFAYTPLIVNSHMNNLASSSSSSYYTHPLVNHEQQQQQQQQHQVNTIYLNLFI